MTPYMPKYLSIHHASPKEKDIILHKHIIYTLKIINGDF